MARVHRCSVKQVIKCHPILAQRLCWMKKIKKGGARSTCNHHCIVYSSQHCRRGSRRTGQSPALPSLSPCHTVQASTDVPCPAAVTCPRLFLNPPQAQPSTWSRAPAAHVPGSQDEAHIPAPSLGGRGRKPALGPAPSPHQEQQSFKRLVSETLPLVDPPGEYSTLSILHAQGSWH